MESTDSCVVFRTFGYRVVGLHRTHTLGGMVSDGLRGPGELETAKLDDVSMCIHPGRMQQQQQQPVVVPTTTQQEHHHQPCIDIVDKSPVCFYDVNGRNTPGPTTPPRSNFRATSVVTEPIPDTRPRDTQISHNGECIRFGTVQSVMVVVVVKESCSCVASDRKPLAYRRLDNTTAAPRARTHSPVGFRIHTATGSRRGKAWSDYSLNKTVVRVHNKLRQLLRVKRSRNTRRICVFGVID